MEAIVYLYMWRVHNYIEYMYNHLSILSECVQ